MPKIISTSWFSYMKELSAKTYDLDIEKLEIPALFQVPLQKAQNFFQYNIPVIYIADYTTGAYRTMSDTSQLVIGHKATEFLKNGIQFTVDQYHPDDMRLFNESIFIDRLAVLKNIPAEQHHNYIFSYSYRMKKRTGDYITLLQRNCFIKSTDKNAPLLSMGMVLNVTHHTPSSPIIQSVEEISEYEDGMFSSEIFKKCYYHNPEDRVFSKREIEILKATADGLEYKEIAKLFFIAEGTVLQHRKNMLQKSNTKNAAELVAYAIKNHYL